MNNHDGFLYSPGGQSKKRQEGGEAAGLGRHRHQHKVHRGDCPAHAAHAVCSPLHVGHVLRVLQPQYRARILQP